ncbi:hypothetical protein Q4Q35_20015 [Flavivirga aquimarina]|uniref:Secreted protein n=1 Tax=Flavivirga aquimarina TaxID=2027862 RepID=A0ABT8WG49_9FLAO|nr:hypothetical protein [Flavivirga aquimarina]MDO5972093.1 hypothetical protein [Flavivirga aquimarina]
MKKLFFIALFAIGLSTTVHSQCVSDYNYNDFTLCGLDEVINFNGGNSGGNRCIIWVNGSNKYASIYIGGTEYSASLQYRYLLAGLDMYHVEIDADGDTYEFMVGVNGYALEEYDICKN